MIFQHNIGANHVLHRKDADDDESFDSELSEIIVRGCLNMTLDEDDNYNEPSYFIEDHSSSNESDEGEHRVNDQQTPLPINDGMDNSNNSGRMYF